MNLKENMRHTLKKNPDLAVGEYLAGVGKPVNTVLLIILIAVVLLLIIFLIAPGKANS